MAGRFSRRQLLGGFFGGLAAWLAGKALPSPAAAEPSPMPVAAEPRHPMLHHFYCNDGCTVTTYVYDTGAGIRP
jgi:hypothetical protein